MTKKQFHLLKFAYREPKTVQQIYKKFNIDYEPLALLTLDIQHLFDFELADKYENSLFSLTHQGETAYEKWNTERKSNIRLWITTIIAVAALLDTILFRLFGI